MDDLQEEVVQLVGEALRLPPNQWHLLRKTAGYENIPEWTSAAHVLIIVALEDKFGLEIPESEIIRLINIPRIMQFLRPRLQA